jgi:SAM-dependent methyltransferase
LFATTLAAYWPGYIGYDPDTRLVTYAGRLHHGLRFTDDEGLILARGPYDLVLANCCFHHIPDDDTAVALEFIRRSLSPSGHFVLVDIQAPDQAQSYRHVYRLLERGAFIRTRAEYLGMIERDFVVVHREETRAHLFSTALCPFYSPLATYVCRVRPGEPG